MTAPAVALVKPTEFGAQFSFNATTKQWSVKVLSADVGNLLTAGADGGAKITPAIIQAAQAVGSVSYDSTNQQFTFNDGLGHATVVPLNAADVHVSGASLAGTVLTLTESNGGATVTVDLGRFLQTLALANTSGVSLSGSGAAGSSLTAALIVDPLAGNLLKVTGTGVKVDPSDVLALLNANTTLALAVDTNAGTFSVTVNGNKQSVGLINLTDSSGTRFGSAFS